MAKELVAIENTRFIYSTNFSGDPDADAFGSSDRKANVIIPDVMQARDMIEAGFNVKMTKPKEGEEEGYMPTYYVVVKCNFETNWPPKIILVTEDGDCRQLDSESVGSIDFCKIKNVDVVLNPYHNERNNTNSLYVRTMYVTQDMDDDPFARKYRRTVIE